MISTLAVENLETVLRDVVRLGGDMHCAEVIRREVSKREYIPGWTIRAISAIRRGMGDAQLASRLEAFLLETEARH